MFASLNIDHLAGASLSLGLGLLVGLQRGWSLRDLADGMRFAGVRTFALMGLAGGISGLLYVHAQGPATVLIGASAMLVIYGYYRANKLDGFISGTSGMAGIVTLACGFLAGSGEGLLATAIAVMMVLLLAVRSQLHGWIKHLSEQEMIAIARFALIAMVILPVLPDRGFGPYQAWNPRHLWMVVVLVSGFSFAGYFAARLLGPSRGIIATAAAGAVVSSTAVTASLATKLRNGEGSPALLAAGISAASAVMFLRVLVLVAALAPFALGSLSMLIWPGIVVSLGSAAWFLRSSSANGGQEVGSDVKLRNPFDLGPAFLLTILVMVLTVAARWVLESYGDQGLAMVLAISGTVDVDSAIITMGNLPHGTIDASIAGMVLAVPVILNTLFKAAVTISIGGWRLGQFGAWPLVASILAIGAAFLAIQ